MASNNEDIKFHYQKLSTHYYSPGTVKAEAGTCEDNVSTPTAEPVMVFLSTRKYIMAIQWNAAYTPNTTTQLSGEYNSLNVDPNIYVKLRMYPHVLGACKWPPTPP